ncbi:helix-turn-helix domain-containing protein [Halococcus sp. IIIV-5B]|uniref:helix-turn-helix domain-containing protein n=1 Tax=Halococcus sp. IIIV-5B TaxID=2321230 RepID=UPI000E716E54|nr:helix-turn-helix domain-containing protein [Halococcus sp. IIIV-5B]RJT07196.1 helix-turn-helix domain-containing protein [Halococcus sp. IIIV-5B]
MAIVAEILLPSESFPLVKLAQSLPNREISLSQIIPLKGSQYLFLCSIEADAREAFDDAVGDQSEIVEVNSVGQTPDGWFYQVVVEQDTNLPESHDPTEFEGALMEATVTGEGWVEQKVFADYDALSTLRDRCQVFEIPFKLLNISSDPDHPDERAQFGLTDRQYEAIRVAFSLGYYDTPRTASTAAVAEELGISAPAVSDLLRRAEHKLISQTVAERYISSPMTAQ